MRNRPVHLTFFVTRRCNARCPFCFYEKARNARDGAPELGLDEIRRIAGSMGRLLWVLFSGGEPFLREDLAEISRIFHDTNHAGFLTVPTNGLLPEIAAETTEAILKRCPDSVVVLKLSLDGIGKDHDVMRRVPGAFASVMRTYERLAALSDRYPRLELGVNTVFCERNQWRMDEIVDFVGRLGRVRSHTISMVRGEAGEESWGEVDLGQYERVMARLDARWSPARRHRFAGGRLKAAQDRLRSRLVHRTLLEQRRVIPCQAGRLSVVLSETGELYPCEGRWADSFGNVRAAGHEPAALLRSGRAERILGEIAGGQCHCTNECNMTTNILFNPAVHPALLREYARLRLGVLGARRKGEEQVNTCSSLPAGEAGRSFV